MADIPDASEVAGMKKNTVATATALACLLPVTANADPISIFGLDWSMTPMVETLEAKGYLCEKYTQYDVYTCWRQDGGYLILRNESDQIEFFCSIFSGCDYTVEEVSDGIVDAGVVKRLIPADEYGRGRSYCARGDEGDRICVVPGPVILFEKGRLGAGDMSFD